MKSNVYFVWEFNLCNSGVIWGMFWGVILDIEYGCFVLLDVNC